MPELEPSADAKRGRTKIAATIFVAHAIKHLYNSGQGSLIMPEIKISLGLSRAQFGSLATSSSIAWWTSTMFAGFLGDRFSNRAGMMLALAMSLMGGAFFLVGIAPGYKTMLVVMFVAGIGPSMFHPPALGELSRRFPDRRGFAVSLHGMGANIGEVLGAPAVAGLLTFMMWRDIMKTSLGPALIVAAAVWLLMPSRKAAVEETAESTRSYFSSLAALMHNRVLMLLIVATALRSIGEGGVGGFLSLYMREDLEYTATKVALILSIAQASGIISQPIMGILSDRVGRKPVLVAGTGLVMLSAFALAVARPGIQLFLAIMVRGAFSFSLHHIFVAAALDAARGVAQSTVVSLIYGAGFLGTFSPFVAGLISDKYGIHSVFVYGGVMLIFPTVLLVMANLGEKEVEALTPPE
jgi:MFS transporter, FSR family, fosmidomycin resistance protein